MNIIEWKPSVDIIAGTTLRDIHRAENNDMALHTGHDKHAVIENRKTLSRQLGIGLNQWVFAQQTHSDHLYEVKKADAGRGTLIYEDGIADCDALYTHEAGIALGVFHADCVPVLLYDPITQIICAIHSGWQGTVKEITSKCVHHLVQKEGIDPVNLHAYIGPAIALHSFEVGMDVVEKVKAMSFDTSSYIIGHNQEKAYVDNKGLNANMLINAGVLKEHIRINPNDTFMKNDSLFSYRRDHDCGRHLSFIIRP